jgi:glutamine cyclotransferase
MRKNLIFGILLFSLVLSFLSVSWWTLHAEPPGESFGKIPVYGFEIVTTYLHDQSAFTEGLVYKDGILIEGTGLLGRSTIRKVNLENGEVIDQQNLSDKYFGEGVTLFGDSIFQLTEYGGCGFQYDLDTLTPQGTFPSRDTGWGLTTDGRYLIMSDGSSKLSFLDPSTFDTVRMVQVHNGNDPVSRLNELEYVDGEIYANIWPTNTIAIISPDNGEVHGWIDLTGILSPEQQKGIGLSEIPKADASPSWTCPNGIAYDAKAKRLFVTGKLWPTLYEIRLVRQ